MNILMNKMLAVLSGGWDHGGWAVAAMAELINKDKLDGCMSCRRGELEHPWDLIHQYLWIPLRWQEDYVESHSPGTILDTHLVSGWFGNLLPLLETYDPSIENDTGLEIIKPNSLFIQTHHSIAHCLSCILGRREHNSFRFWSNQLFYSKCKLQQGCIGMAQIVIHFC